jgi:hypothetical protein
MYNRTLNKRTFTYLSKQLAVWLVVLSAASLLLIRPAAAAFQGKPADQPENPPAPSATIVSIRVSAPAASEAGQEPATIAIVRNGSAAAPLDVFYTVVGTTTPGDDYVALPGRATIPAGSNNVTVSIEPKDDTSKEGAEMVVISLEMASGYTIVAPTSATVWIADDDMPGQVVSFYVGDSNAAEPGTDTGELTIARNGSTAAPLTIFYTVGGTASPGVDYIALPSSVTIAAGKASVVLKVTPLDDIKVEGTEIVVLSLNQNASYSISAPASATVAIVDNDNVPAGAPQYSIFLPSLLRGR